MKKLKSLQKLTYDQYLKRYGKNHRYCVQFSTHGRTISRTYYRTLSKALANSIYTSFEQVWTNRSLVYKDYPLGKEAERVELMEWPEPTGKDAQMLLAAPTEQTRFKLIGNIYRNYGNIISIKASFFTKETRAKKGEYVKGLFCWSRTLGFYVGANIKPEKKKKNIGGNSRQDQSLGHSGGSLPSIQVPLPQWAGSLSNPK